jgi:hypothetical protein
VGPQSPAFRALSSYGLAAGAGNLTDRE